MQGVSEKRRECFDEKPAPARDRTWISVATTQRLNHLTTEALTSSRFVFVVVIPAKWKGEWFPKSLQYCNGDKMLDRLVLARCDVLCSSSEKVYRNT